MKKCKIDKLDSSKYVVLILEPLLDYMPSGILRIMFSLMNSKIFMNIGYACSIAKMFRGGG